MQTAPRTACDTRWCLESSFHGARRRPSGSSNQRPPRWSEPKPQTAWRERCVAQRHGRPMILLRQRLQPLPGSQPCDRRAKSQQTQPTRIRDPVNGTSRRRPTAPSTSAVSTTALSTMYDVDQHSWRRRTTAAEVDLRQLDAANNNRQDGHKDGKRPAMSSRRSGQECRHSAPH